MEEIKKLSMDDYGEISKLSQFAFQYTLDKDAYKRKREEDANHDIYGFLVDGKIAGKTHILPFDVIVGEKKIPMGGVASVATWPEYRRQGVAKQLLHHALVKMDQADIPLSYLHPFFVQFYRKLGWELCFDNYHLQIPITNLTSTYNFVNGYIERTKEKLDVVKEVYHQYALQFNGMLDRSDDWWNNRVLNNDSWHIAIAYNAQDEAEAYVIYKVEENIFDVRDFAYTNMNGKKSLFAFIANHDSMAKKVKITMPTNDLLRITLDNPLMENEIVPYFMARIVNVEKFFKIYPFRSKNIDITIKVEDSFYDVNEGVYHFVLNNGEVSIGKKQREQVDFTCSIQQLSAIMLGYQCPVHLLNNECIAGDVEKIADFKKVLHTKQTFLPDFF